MNLLFAWIQNSNPGTSIERPPEVNVEHHSIGVQRVGRE